MCRSKALIVLVLFLVPTHAEETVPVPSPDDLILGTSLPLSGPERALGRAVLAGLETALAEANAAGGVDGRSISLLVRDDGYEPRRTSIHMQEFSGRADLLAVVGSVGTPTAIAALPVARKHQIPMIGLVTGADLLRSSPPDPLVFNFRASYRQEVQSTIDQLIAAGIKPDQIAFFTQRDGYGDSGFWGGVAALKQHGLTQIHRIPHGRYTRNSLAVEHGLADILESGADVKAVIMVGTCAPCVKFIRESRKRGYDFLCVGVSFCTAAAMAAGLPVDEDGVFITQVVAHPEADTRAAGQFRRAWQAQARAGKPTHLSFEGYLVGRLVLEALAKVEGEIDRTDLLDVLERMNRYDLGLDQSITLGPDDHQASDQVYLTQVTGGRVKSCSWERLRQSVRGELDLTEEQR